jgi:transposase
MSRFIAVDRDTVYLLPPSVDEWLPQDHLARFVVEVIDQLDLSKLIGQYAGRGSDAYHPAMLLGLLVYGYATGVHSSRKIERACHDSIAFRFIAANTQPEIAANASKHKALSWEHANRIEAKLREEVQQLLKLAEDSDSRPVNNGLDVPAEIARREQRLGAIAASQGQDRAACARAPGRRAAGPRSQVRQAPGPTRTGQEAAWARPAATVQPAQGQRPGQPHRRRVAHHAHLAWRLRAKLQRPGRGRYPDDAGGDGACLASAQRQA